LLEHEPPFLLCELLVKGRNRQILKAYQ